MARFFARALIAVAAVFGQTDIAVEVLMQVGSINAREASSAWEVWDLCLHYLESLATVEVVVLGGAVLVEGRARRQMCPVLLLSLRVGLFVTHWRLLREWSQSSTASRTKIFVQVTKVEIEQMTSERVE